MRNIFLPLILLMWGCATPSEIVQRTLDNTFRRDSMTVEYKPQMVFSPASKDTVYLRDTVIVRDSVKVPVVERLESKDGKTKITIDRRDLNKIYGIVDQQDDSIKTLVKIIRYFTDESRFKQETKVIESDELSTKEMFLYAFGLVGMILLITVLRK